MKCRLSLKLKQSKHDEDAASEGLQVAVHQFDRVQLPVTDMLLDNVETNCNCRASMCVYGVVLQLTFTSRLVPSSFVACPKLIVNTIIMHVSCHVHVGHHSLPPLVDSAPHPGMLYTVTIHALKIQ